VFWVVMARSGNGAGLLPNIRTSLVEVGPAPSASISMYRVVVHLAAMMRFVPILSSIQALVRGPSFGSGGRTQLCGLCLGGFGYWV